MNKKLSYIILTLLCISNSTKSYSQREIHPLEPMFTYDYAFKYYGNLTLDNFWSLENFKAPKGIKSIEEYEEHSSEDFRRRVSFFHNTNRIHFYNKETGFLEKTITYDERNGFKEKRNIQIYKYRIDGLNLIINVEYSFFGKELYDSQYLRYVYDLKTENLVEFGFCNKVESEQITRYTYDENQKDLISILKDEVEKNKIFIRYDTLQPFDKINFFHQIGETYKGKDYSVCPDKSQKPVNNYQRNLSLRTFSKGYDFKREEYVDVPNITYSGYIYFTQHHISYDLGNISYDNPQPVYLGSNNHKIQGTFLFSENGELYFIKIPKNIVHKWFEQDVQEQSVSIFEKKHDTKWEFNAYDKVYLTKKFMRKGYRYKSFDKISHIYEIKNSSIYKNNKPLIIYNYN